MQPVVVFDKYDKSFIIWHADLETRKLFFRTGRRTLAIGRSLPRTITAPTLAPFEIAVLLAASLKPSTVAPQVVGNVRGIDNET